MQIYALATSIPVEFILKDKYRDPINDVKQDEDVGMRGNVYIFKIIEVVSESDNPQTNHKYKLLCHEEVKGSVTAICNVKGYLLTCVSPKDYILLGDVYKSVWFLGFQEESAKLILVACTVIQAKKILLSLPEDLPEKLLAHIKKRFEEVPLAPVVMW
ncbi:14089_t:CDS:2 [Funneliformis geosporum]|nr:14089_t:CDS:2 [Funneliformis geosporum]